MSKLNEIVSKKIQKRLNFEWMDPRLAWNESHANGIENVRLNRKDVWLPDFEIYNLVKMNHLGREGNDEVYQKYSFLNTVSSWL